MSTESPSDDTSCPACGSAEVVQTSEYGHHLLTRQLSCTACGQAFEALRTEETPGRRPGRGSGG